MKKWLFLLLLAAVAGGGAYYWFGTTRTQNLTEKSLTFAEVRQTAIRDIVSATGLVEPRETVVVSAETPGTIMRLWGRVGDLVTEGGDLAQLDDRKIGLKYEEAENGILMAKAAVLQTQAALTQALASEEAAQRNLKIQEELAATAGFRSEREQAKAQVQAAVAGIRAAQAGIEVAKAKEQAMLTALKEADLARKMARIKVPGSITAAHGMAARKFLILDRRVQEGQMVGPQAGPLFILAGSLDTVEVHAQVAEGDVNKIRKGLTALFKITNYEDEEADFQGTVKEIRPLATNIKGAVYYDTVVEVKNRKDPTTGEWQLRPGMTASIDIIRREHKKVWKAPVTALNFVLEDAYQSDAARAKVAEWKKRPDAKDWQALWTWDDAAQRVQPIFIRIGGVLKNGETGLKDSDGIEILEWEQGKEPTAPLRVIINAPPARAPGFFDQPANVKI